MIVSNLATYPPRRASMLDVVKVLAPQLDRLNVVLNEYEDVPEELRAHSNVVGIIPLRDTKDAGKFLPDVSDAEHVLLVDDDLVYPDDYVARTIASFEALGPSGFVGAYHGSLYVKPPFKLKRAAIAKWFRYRLRRNAIADFRRVFTFYRENENPVVVDQIASGVAILRGRDMPPFSYMEDSQKFVDVRLARWAFENGLVPVVLPREENWLRPVRFDESIYQDFTQTNPPAVAREIRTYAFKVRHRGEILPL